MNVVVCDVHKQFMCGDEKYVVLDGVSFSLLTCESCCITGESGCGKTTLLAVIAGMLCPERGKVTFDETDVYALSRRDRILLRNKQAAYIMQNSGLISSLTVSENIIFPQTAYGRSVDESYLQQLKELLRIYRIQDSHPDHISGGEYRRVCIARALYARPSLLIADEPTSNLDENNASIVFEAFENMKKNGMNIIVASHDRRFMKGTYAMYELKNGTLHENK